MKFLSAADFDDAITAASKIRAATSYVMLAVGVANSAYSNGALEAYTPPGAYTAGARPGVGFHASGSFGTYLYAQAASDLRLRTDAGLDYTLWHSGNARSDSQNDTRYSQLGHTHAISEVTGLQAALDARPTGTGTAGRYPKYATSSTLVDGILSESGISVTANGGVFVSDVAHNSNVRGYGLWASGFARWAVGKAGTESGSDSGSDFVLWSYNDGGTFLREPLRISRATGNATFSGTITASGGNSTNWNTAVSWGNHASAGYVPSTRTITINGTTFDLSANRSWTVAGGVGGSGTNGFVTKWNGANLADSSIDDSDTSYIKTSKGAYFGQGGGRWHIAIQPSTTGALLYWNDPTATGAYVAQGDAGGLHFVGLGIGYHMSLLPSQDVRIYKQLNMQVATGTAPFQIFSTTMSPNLNADMVDGLHASSFALASSLSGYVPTTRTITINSTTFDLSANRTWTIAAGIGGSATTGRLPKMATGTTITDSLLSESGIGIIANGGVFVSDVAHNSNARGYSLWASGLNRWVFGKAGTESGSDSGSDFVLWSYNDAGTFLREPFRVSRATGNVTFTGTVSAGSFAVGANTSAQWTQAFSWGNHAAAGYATLTYLTTNYYTKASIDGMVSGYVPDSRQVLGTGSIQGGGNLGVNRSFNLYGDQDNPGTNKYYGTDGSGGKGWYSLPSGGGVSGSGTANILPLWNGSTSLTNSALLQAAGSVFVGGSSNRYSLVCSNALTLRSMSASELASYTPPAEGSLVYQYDGTSGVYVYTTGSGWVRV